ncbi:hypothetical protein JCM8547_008018 [Rhodosporidiobolus lusitaniae]
MSNNLSHSMRDNYNTHGVEEYYKKVQESYRNPHFPGLRRVLVQFLDQYVAQEKPKRIRVLDLAAGSGEATIVINDWYTSRWPSTSSQTSSSSSSSAPSPSPAPAPPPPSLPHIRQYPSLAPRQPFIPPSARQPFIPPSRQPVARPSPSSSSSSSPARPPHPKPLLSITASDPYTAPAYKQRTGLDSCLELSFADVAGGMLPPLPSLPLEGEEGGEGGEKQEGGEEEVYDIVVISFALHLVESTSELWSLLSELSKRAKWLVVTAPHKKPDIKPTWSWRRWDPSSAWSPADPSREGHTVGGAEGDGFEIVLERTRLRVWRSEVWWEG